jgi:hypothetical protein
VLGRACGQLGRQRLGDGDQPRAPLSVWAASSITPTATSRSTGTPLVTMSYTAERACARSTTSRSFSSGRFAGDPKRDADALEAVAHLVGRADGAAPSRSPPRASTRPTVSLDVARRRDSRRSTSSGRRRARAGCTSDRIRPRDGAEQDRRLTGVELECLRAPSCPSWPAP